jgi:biopolymer transport protein ExbD
MYKFNKKRMGVAIDMTPMVDVAFLLLTFFMLASKFRPAEEVTINLPSSSAVIKLPESDVMTINVSKEGGFYLGVDRPPLMAKLFGEQARFKASMPVPKEKLFNMIKTARLANVKMRTVIKGDVNSDYGNIVDLMEMLQKQGITRFNFVTEWKQD